MLKEDGNGFFERRIKATCGPPVGHLTVPWAVDLLSSLGSQGVVQPCCMDLHGPMSSFVSSCSRFCVTLALAMPGNASTNGLLPKPAGMVRLPEFVGCLSHDPSVGSYGVKVSPKERLLRKKNPWGTTVGSLSLEVWAWRP